MFTSAPLGSSQRSRLLPAPPGSSRPPLAPSRLQLRGELSDLRVGGRLHRLELSRRSLTSDDLG